MVYPIFRITFDFWSHFTLPDRNQTTDFIICWFYFSHSTCNDQTQTNAKTWWLITAINVSYKTSVFANIFKVFVRGLRAAHFTCEIQQKWTRLMCQEVWAEVNRKFMLSAFVHRATLSLSKDASWLTKQIVATLVCFCSRRIRESIGWKSCS